MAGHDDRTTRDPGTGPELLERDTLGRLTPVVSAGSAGGRGRLRGLSVPGAVIGTFLVTSLMFGAGGFRPIADLGSGAASSTGDPTASPASPGQSGAADGIYGRGGGPGGSDGAKGGEDGGTGGTDQVVEPSIPAPEPTDGATDEPAPEPTAITVTPIELTARAADGAVTLAWTGCAPESFAYWKVVRSWDASVSWPTGDNDALIAVSQDPAARSAVDDRAAEGRPTWYRVFAVVEVGGSLIAACASNADAVTVPAPNPTEEPAPDPTDAPAMALSITSRNGYAFLHWTTCTSNAFDYYKVVVSPDSTVRWPLGDNDTLEAAIGDRSETTFKDTDAEAGKTLYYRVFCVQATDAGYRILDATPVKSFKAAAQEPAPDPSTMAFEATYADGAVQLAWEACGSEGFVYYKVVRSQNPNPSYLPWTDGTELIGVIGDPSSNGYSDGDVASGQTWYYRIQALAWWNGQKIVVGQTAVIEVTIP